jgi:hypothetical protein
MAGLRIQSGEWKEEQLEKKPETSHEVMNTIL